MALDGIYLYNLINELKDSLINSRIPNTLDYILLQ